MAQSILKVPEVLKFDTDFFTKCKMLQERVLDNGMCGQIVVASHLGKPDLKCVVKKFSLLNKEKLARNKRAFYREVKFMQSLQHPYLTKCICAAKCPEYLAISMKHYSIRTLNFCVGDIGLDLSELCIVQVACALRYMHKNNLVHLDVKLDNIFLDEERNAILGDFGLAVKMTPQQQTLPKKNIGGTVGYLSPEWRAASAYVELDPYKMDSFSLGVVLWALAFEREPEENVNYYFVTMKHRDLKSNIRDMLLPLLQPNPARRVTVADLLHRVRPDSTHGHVIDNN